MRSISLVLVVALAASVCCGADISPEDDKKARQCFIDTIKTQDRMNLNPRGACQECSSNISVYMLQPIWKFQCFGFWQSILPFPFPNKPVIGLTPSEDKAYKECYR